MNRILVICILLLLCAASMAQQNITADRAPKTVEEFLELRQKLAGSPEGGAALFVFAMLRYVEDETVGMQFLTIAMDRSNLQESKDRGSYKGYMPLASFGYHFDQLKRRPYVASSYFDGTSPRNSYALPNPPYRFTMSRNRYSVISDSEIKVFVHCSGADSPRPVCLRRNNRGIWKVLEVSSLFVGIRPPLQNEDDDI